MVWKNLKLLAAAVMIATGLIGFAIGQWATADGPKKPKDEPAAAAKDKDTPPKPAAKLEDAKPDPTPRRREAVIRMPVGTFVKEVEVPEYGNGRISWTYDDDKVLGTIEGNVMGVEFEIETEAEVSMSSNGTIYGLVTAAKVTHLKVGGDLAEELGEYAAFFPLIEPWVNEMLVDLPFSYQFRMKGDRLTILSYRTLMSGPNPLGSLSLLGGDLGGIMQIMLGFQALSKAIEGTYTSADALEKQAPKKKTPFRKPTEAPKRSGKADMVLPSPSYLKHRPQYFPPDDVASPATNTDCENGKCAPAPLGNPVVQPSALPAPAKASGKYVPSVAAAPLPVALPPGANEDDVIPTPAAKKAKAPPVAEVQPLPPEPKPAPAKAKPKKPKAEPETAYD